MMIAERDSISGDPIFKKTKLYRSFLTDPLGFIDIGSSGGVHPLILPVASITHCICFEPDGAAYNKLNNRRDPFHKITVFQAAVGGKAKMAKLYLTKSRVNSSFLYPSAELINRYNAAGFKVENVQLVENIQLDGVTGVFSRKRLLGEILKIDCQGAEFEVLKGAKTLLDTQSCALHIEIEFSRMYKSQKLFGEIDELLRRKGFILYGIYPRFISAKKLNRRAYESEERIICADAVYFRDPMAAENKNRDFTARQINVLFVSALLTGFYDFALEILDKYYEEPKECGLLRKLVLQCARKAKNKILSGLSDLSRRIGMDPENRYLLAKKFIDKNRHNNNIDFLTI